MKDEQTSGSDKAEGDVRCEPLPSSCQKDQANRRKRPSHEIGEPRKDCNGREQ